MSNAKPSNHQVDVEPGSVAPFNSLTTEAPKTREQPSQRMVKRGDTRRRLEDLMLAKETQDLW